VEPSRFIIFNSFEAQISKLTSAEYIGKSKELTNVLLKASETEYLAMQHKFVSDEENTKHTLNVICTSLFLTSAIN
jgi:hypothetical protein